MTPPPFLTVLEVAERLAVSDMTIYREIEQGHLIAFRVGRNLRIDPRDVVKYLREHRTVPFVGEAS